MIRPGIQILEGEIETKKKEKNKNGGHEKKEKKSIGKESMNKDIASLVFFFQ